MDRLIASTHSFRDRDLMISTRYGVAYQVDMDTRSISYDSDYWAKVSAYESLPVAMTVNAARCELLMRYLPRAARVLDYGCGNGAFIRIASGAGFDVDGFDVIPEAVAMLKQWNKYVTDPRDYDAVTAWDVIEHIDEPNIFLERIRKNAFLFVSLPVFDDLMTIRESKHYRPGEHLYYWTAGGLIRWMASRGFDFIEYNSAEIKAGRTDIGQFAFRCITSH
jgi:SAM-dependent methyltransferase